MRVLWHGPAPPPPCFLDQYHSMGLKTVNRPMNIIHKDLRHFLSSKLSFAGSSIYGRVEWGRVRVCFRCTSKCVF